MGTEGLANIFATQRRRLEALARGIVGNREDAADVVSDAFIAFLERGPRDADEASAWLYVVTRNKARNRVRDLGRAARRPQPRLEPSVDTPPIDSRVTALLEAAAGALPARDARALDFRYRYGLDYAEVAAALGLSVGATRVVVHRASRRLRAHVVGLLADHHGVAGPCKTELLRDATRGRIRDHDGCRTCGLVAEEVHALSARGVVALPIPLGDRLVDNPLNRWLASRWPGRIVSPSPRVTEAAAALLTSGALLMGGTGGSLSPIAAPPHHESGIVVPLTRGQADALNVSVATPAVDVDAAQAVVDRIAVAAPSGIPGNLKTFADGGNDSDDAVSDVFAFPNLLGVPLYEPDALDSALPPSQDVRSVHVGTIATQSGEPSGLYFRIGLAAAPDGGSSFNVSFMVGDSPCRWSMWIHPDIEYNDHGIASDDHFLGTFHTYFSESCAPQSSEQGWAQGYVDYIPYADDEATSFSESFWRGYQGEESPLRATQSGRGVSLEIPFDAMAERYQARIGTADRLRGIEVVATGDDPRYFDRVPDAGELSYRIERA